LNLITIIFSFISEKYYIASYINYLFQLQTLVNQLDLMKLILILFNLKSKRC
jgi:hypothetical protein